MKQYKEKLLPLSLTALIILVDQLTKAFIVRNWPQTGLIKDVFNNNFLWIYHVRNKAIAFSMGENFPEFIKPVVFIVVPVLVLAFLVWYYFKSGEFNKIQLWAAAGVIGGGTGNVIDRVFRPDGVVDFISVRIYGLFGMDRWPTFNVADSSVVVCCILLFVTILAVPKKTNDVEKNEVETSEVKTNE